MSARNVQEIGPSDKWMPASPISYCYHGLWVPCTKADLTPTVVSGTVSLMSNQRSDLLGYEIDLIIGVVCGVIALFILGFILGQRTAPKQIIRRCDPLCDLQAGSYTYTSEQEQSGGGTKTTSHTVVRDYPPFQVRAHGIKEKETK